MPSNKTITSIRKVVNTTRWFWMLFLVLRGGDMLLLTNCSTFQSAEVKCIQLLSKQCGWRWRWRWWSWWWCCYCYLYWLGAGDSRFSTRTSCGTHSLMVKVLIYRGSAATKFHFHGRFCRQMLHFLRLSTIVRRSAGDFLATFSGTNNVITIALDAVIPRMRVL